MIKKIRLKTSMAGPMGNFAAESMPMVPEEISLELAKQLVDGGYAVIVDQQIDDIKMDIIEPVNDLEVSKNKPGQRKRIRS